MLNYDPDSLSEIDINSMREAEEYGMHPIHIICDEAGAQVGDPSGVSFFAFVHFVPRSGEIITLEDGTRCQVDKVLYKVTNINGFKSVIPNVCALRIS